MDFESRIWECGLGLDPVAEQGYESLGSIKGWQSGVTNLTSVIRIQLLVHMRLVPRMDGVSASRFYVWSANLTAERAVWGNR
jgi:hypothetical protein